MTAYLISDYSASGEGRTVCIMVLTIPHGVERTAYINSEFTEKFDDFYSIGMEEISLSELEIRYVHLIPKMVYDLLHDEMGCNLHWHAQIHYNFS